MNKSGRLNIILLPVMIFAICFFINSSLSIRHLTNYIISQKVPFVNTFISCVVLCQIYTKKDGSTYSRTALFDYTPCELHHLRGGASHYVLLFAKRSQSNLHSLAYKQACRLASFDYTPCELHHLRGGASHYVLLFAKRSRSNLHSLADKRACRLASFDYREYDDINCTKFAPKSHHIKRLFSSTNWNLNVYLLIEIFEIRQSLPFICCLKQITDSVAGVKEPLFLFILCIKEK